MAESNPSVARASTAQATPIYSYVEWGPVIAGAVAATAVSLVLLTFGAAVGLAAVSPWSLSPTRVSAVGLGSAFWILIVSLWSFALGGYLSARLRHRLSDATKSEIEFRDKAHGLLSWATVVVFAALVGGMSASRAIRDGGVMTNPLTASAVDRIVRTTKPNIPVAGADLRGEVSRIFATHAQSASIDDPDRTYLVRLVQERSDAAEPDALKRVNDAFAQLKSASDRARKAGVVMGFLVAATLLVGAAIAWWAAGVGGAHRDEGTMWRVFGLYVDVPRAGWHAPRT